MSTSSAPPSGPCGPARNEVDTRCAEAERLAQAAVAHQQRLRDVKHQLVEIAERRDGDAQVRDRRQLGAAKDAAKQAYRAAITSASDQLAVQQAARTWLHEIDGLNRRLERAGREAEEVARSSAELESTLPRVELAADAARIAAETAQVACLEARRALATCEEEAQRALRGTPTPLQPTTLPFTLVLRADREALLALTLRLADETGVEAGRLQLLLLEMIEALTARALEEQALRFPEEHPFWGQFPADGGQRVAASLAAMNYRFDGRDGWADGRAPTIRELAIALSHCGLDPRTLRRPSSQQAIDELWRGTSVDVHAYLVATAPDLDLQELMTVLGPRAGRLAELWDMWGRLRPLLLTPA